MKKKDVPELFPVVCAAGEHYVICIPTPVEMLIRVDVGDESFYCDDNGVRKSGDPVQKFYVPQRLLDRHREYKVVFSVVRQRKPYFTELYKEETRRFRFIPVPETGAIHVAHLSDIHGLRDEAIRCGRFFGQELHLLILNGDVSSSSNTEEEILLPLEIAHEITQGGIPCIISRGNHDLRGVLAEKLGAFYPTENGKTYFTVELPGWTVIVLDCGEDKMDDCAEYGGTVSFHSFRRRETDFLKEIAERSADGLSPNRKIVLSHIPFMYHDTDPQFDIENELYSEWCRIIRTKIHPAFGLFGHLHRMSFYPSGDPFDAKHFGSPIIIGGKPMHDNHHRNVEGAFITLRQDAAEIIFADAKHEVSAKHILHFSTEVDE